MNTSYKTLKIKDWALEDRPREKLMSKGLNSLSDAELIAILLGSGNKDKSAVELAREILSFTSNNLNELGKISVLDLQNNFKGIGQAKAITIIAALELGRRRSGTEAIKKEKISSSNDAFQIFHPLLADLRHEELWMLILSRSNKVIDKVKISQGGISGTVTDVRLILKNALDRLASSIIICHNHPSGNTEPSSADKAITNKIKDAGIVMEIPLLDHLIICNTTYFSFADNGIL